MSTAPRCRAGHRSFLEAHTRACCTPRTHIGARTHGQTDASERACLAQGLACVRACVRAFERACVRACAGWTDLGPWTASVAAYAVQSCTKTVCHTSACAWRLAFGSAISTTLPLQQCNTRCCNIDRAAAATVQHTSLHSPLRGRACASCTHARAVRLSRAALSAGARLIAARRYRRGRRALANPNPQRVLQSDAHSMRTQACAAHSQALVALRAAVRARRRCDTSSGEHQRLLCVGGFVLGRAVGTAQAKAGRPTVRAAEGAVGAANERAEERD
jgi:hypothetical protein